MKASTKGAIGASLLSMVHLAKAGAGGPVGGGAAMGGAAQTVTVTATSTAYVPQWTATTTVTAPAPPAQTVTATTTVIPVASTQTSVMTTTGTTTYTTVLPASTLTTTIQGSAVTTTLPASTVTTTAVTTFVTTSVSATTATQTATTVQTAGAKATFAVLAQPVNAPAAAPSYVNVNPAQNFANGQTFYQLAVGSSSQQFALDPSTGLLTLALGSNPNNYFNTLFYTMNAATGQSIILSQSPAAAGSAMPMTCSVSYTNYALTCNWGSTAANFYTCSGGSFYIAQSGSVPSSIPCGSSAVQVKLSAQGLTSPSSALFALTNGAGSLATDYSSTGIGAGNSAGHGYAVTLDAAGFSNPNPNLFSFDAASGNVTFAQPGVNTLAGLPLSYIISTGASALTGYQVVGLDQPAAPLINPAANGQLASTTYYNGVFKCGISSGSLSCTSAKGESGSFYSCTPAGANPVVSVYFANPAVANTFTACTGTIAALPLTVSYR